MEENIIHGKNCIHEALKSGVSLNKVLISDTLHRDKQLNTIIDLLSQKKIPFSWSKRKKLDELTAGEKNQGIVAFRAPYRFYEINEILEQAENRNEDPFLLILDGIEDPHNLGAIIRTAETAGIHGIIIPSRRACPVTSTVVSTSAGAVEHMMIHQASNINSVIDDLKKKNIWIMGIENGAKSPLYKTDLKGPIALVLGSEGKGISKLTLKKCDLTIEIPMQGQISSLNVSAAGAIIIYEALRQRLLK